MDPQKMIQQTLRLQTLQQQISNLASNAASIGSIFPPHKAAPTSNPPAVTPAIAAQLLPVASTPTPPLPTAADSNPTAQANNNAATAASIAAAEAQQKRKRKRKGPPVKKACFHCKKSHLSCSNQRPCQRCQDRGLECYDAPTTQPAKKSRKAKSKNGTPEDNDDTPDSPITVPSTPNAAPSTDANHQVPNGSLSADSNAKPNGTQQVTLPSLTNLASQFPPPTLTRGLSGGASDPRLTQDFLKNTLMEFINRPTTPLTQVPMRDRNGVSTPVNNLPPVPWSPNSPLGVGVPSSGVYFSPVVDNDILGGPAPSPLPLTPSENPNHATASSNNQSQQSSSSSSNSSFAVPQAPPMSHNNAANQNNRKTASDDVLSSSTSSDTSPHQSENNRAESTSPVNYDEIRPQLLYTEMRMMKDILLKQQDAIEKLLSAAPAGSSQSQNSLVVASSSEAADEVIQLKDIALSVMLKMNTAVSVWKRKNFVLVKCNEAFRKLVRDTSAQRRLVEGTSTLHDLLLYAQDKSDVKPMLQLLLSRVINPDGAGEAPIIYKFWAKSLLRDFSGEYVAMSSTFHIEQDYFWIEQVKVPFQSAFDDEFQINDDEIQPKTMDITTKQQVLEKVLRIMAYVEKKKNVANIFTKDV